MGRLDRRCPSCAGALALHRDVVGHEWRCEPCSSAGVPISRLRRERDAVAVSQLWAAGRGAGLASGLPCISCSKPSSRVTVHVPDGEASADVCARCQLAWLSDASLARIPERPRPPSLTANELPPEAKVAYAQAIVSMWRDRIREENDRERAVAVMEGVAEIVSRLTT
jgi:hypothetical protein